MTVLASVMYMSQKCSLIFERNYLWELKPAILSQNTLFRPLNLALVVKNMPANARFIRDAGFIPGLRRSPGLTHNNSLQYSCLENSMDRGAWQATAYRVAKSQTGLK
ncbi:unnamed protein product [Rangifer tarandus platyrhynchus]|uniref:Uncharacterized protein n=1 Tax=Rangifer tarandus platyrhynchus TaxID=3082113 RepID=A0AC59Z1V0_RANTA